MLSNICKNLFSLTLENASSYGEAFTVVHSVFETAPKSRQNTYASGPLVASGFDLRLPYIN